MTEKKVQVTVYMPEFLRRHVKAEAARQGVSMSDLVTDLIQQGMAANSKVPGGTSGT